MKYTKVRRLMASRQVNGGSLQFEQEAEANFKFNQMHFGRDIYADTN